MKATIFSGMLTALAVIPGIRVQAQDIAAQFDMTLSDNTVTESVSNQKFTVNSALPLFNTNGARGKALRFDGYSNYVKAAINTSALGTGGMTFSIWVAPETYPMMNVAEAEATPSYSTIAGNLDEAGKTGFALQLSSQGGLRFCYCPGGWSLTVESSEKLPCGKWNHIAAVADYTGKKTYLYLNGKLVGEGNNRYGAIAFKDGASGFYIGKGAEELKSGVFNINTFCGLIDDITIYNKVLSSNDIAAVQKAESNVDFSYPLSRYNANILRPRFHGMPSGGWTNECHGMAYSDGRYHVFFQKNANGPYMARLHWGHISSENLYLWREEPIALRPSESYDIKGCWSGCVFTDGQLTGGKPGIIYTAVDNAKAVIAQALPADNTLATWEKAAGNPIINGRPSGLSDDFRDPYFFSANGEKYIIVGTSKDNVGACTLHKYSNGNWSNDGKIFFKGTNALEHGTFWEMPNMTDMGNGKWLFTCTPLNTGNGVETLYWVGTVGSDGTFTPDNGMTPGKLELDGMSKDGYGLLSPTIMKDGDKTLLLGIVPDKLPSSRNYEMGWAHCYSLPREISLAADGTLIQKPYGGLTGMRSAGGFSIIDATIEGAKTLSPVSGSMVELCGTFEIGTADFGFNFYKSGNNYGRIYFSPAKGAVIVDLQNLNRIANDNGTFKGLYESVLPERLGTGDKIKMHVFIDHSIMDVFINDKWAFSVRLFPVDTASTGVEAFADGSVKAISLQAWNLNENNTGTGIESVCTGSDTKGSQSFTYTLSGLRVDSTDMPGVYIRNGKKILVRQ